MAASKKPLGFIFVPHHKALRGLTGFTKRLKSALQDAAFGCILACGDLNVTEEASFDLARALALPLPYHLPLLFALGGIAVIVLQWRLLSQVATNAFAWLLASPLGWMLGVASVLAADRWLPRILARISQTPPAATPDSGVSAALPLLGLLDVLHEYDCGGLRRAPCIHAPLRRLATEGFEKCGLGIFGALLYLGVVLCGGLLLGLRTLLARPRGAVTADKLQA